MFQNVCYAPKPRKRHHNEYTQVYTCKYLNKLILQNAKQFILIKNDNFISGFIANIFFTEIHTCKTSCMYL